TSGCADAAAPCPVLVFRRLPLRVRSAPGRASIALPAPPPCRLSATQRPRPAPAPDGLLDSSSAARRAWPARSFRVLSRQKPSPVSPRRGADGATNNRTPPRPPARAAQGAPPIVGAAIPGPVA